MTTIAEMRQTILERAHWGIANEPDVHYLMQRAMQGKEQWKDKVLPIYCDCSEAVTEIWLAAGAPDPNGLGYNGYGNTGTLLDQGTRISFNDAQPADLVIYQRANGETTHVGILLDKANQTLFSHGQERGPIAVSLAVENAYHADKDDAHPVWVRALPTSEKPRWHWEVRDGAGHLLGTATNPPQYVEDHKRLFWRPRMQVRFIRKYDND